MTRLDQIDKNRVVSPTPYLAPGKPLARTGVQITAGHWVLLGLAILAILFILFISFARSVQIVAQTSDLEKPGEMLPVVADVEIESWIKLPVGNRVMVLPGEHQVAVTAQGFAIQREKIEVGGERYHQFPIVLQRLPGALDINLSPEVGAKLLINGQEFADLPGVVEGIPAGRHQITIDAPLYRATTRELLIRGKGLTQSLSVTLQPAWAELSLSSEPSGAIISVDGVESGATPATIKVEEGLRALSLRADKFKPFEQEIAIVALQDVVVPAIQLEPADGILEISTQPPEAAVIVEGQYRGISPMSIKLAPNKRQKVDLYKGGYRVESIEVTALPDQKLTESVQLQQDLAKVEFSVQPADAQIYVDGTPRGRGSQTLMLTTLPHQISVQKPGYVSYTNSIIPSKSSRQLVSVNLLTKEQYYWANIPDTYQTVAGHSMKLFKAPGLVKMGSSRREDGRRANEISYTANLTRHFYVSKHEVTNKQFRAFQPTHNAGNYKKKSLDANKHPAVNVSWQKAAQYCNWLSKREGLTPFYQTKSGFVSGQNPSANGYRLLTEVEWAWLARNKGNEVLVYPWGNIERPASNQPIGNFADDNAAFLLAFTLRGYDDDYQASSPVGRFPPNHRGLYDIAGNASEWVNDWYSAKGNLENGESGKLVDPLGPEIGEFHVVRGASWAKGHLPQLRLAYRDYGAKGKHDIGFRIARYAGPGK